MQKLRAFSACLFLMILSTHVVAVTTPRFAFVVNSSDATVSIYTVNATTGFLRDNGYVLAGSKPTTAAVTPSGAFLYVANSGSANVSAFAVNLANGELTAVAGSPFAAESGATAAAVSPSGKLLYVANDTAGNISAYSINATTGVLTAVAGSPFAAGTKPVALGVDPSGKFLYVVNSGSDNVSGFSIGTSGALTAISGSPFAVGTTPLFLAVTTSDKFVYVANSGSKNVSAFSLNRTTGALTAVSGSPFAAETKPSAVAADPSSKFVYVTNSGSNNISEYKLNATTGALTAISGSPASAGEAPSSVTVDPSGKFVFAGNKTSDDVSMYTLSSSTGALTAIVPGPTRARKAPVSITVSAGTTPITYTPSFAYVADLGGGVPTLAVNASTGDLTAISGSPFGSGSPRSVGFAPNGKFLYTANNSTIGEYTVDSTTGALSSIGTVTAGDAPYAVAVDPSSRFVYAVCIDTNAVYAYKINQTTGALTKVAGSPFTTDIVAPDDVVVDPTGRFLLVAEDCCADTGGVTVYSITPATGKLTAVAGSPFLPSSDTSEPAGVTVDPTGRFVYTANGGGFGSFGITAYSINAATGKLTLVGTLLPGGGNPWAVTTDVTGRYVYMTNNDATIDGYAINSSTGELSALTESPFAASVSTRGLSADPSGSFLYLSNGDQLLGYSIDGATGVLTQLSSSPYSAGIDPLSVFVAGTIH
jgi:6-phosphogluconolactonase (cycloisomerase 2 family)